VEPLIGRFLRNEAEYLRILSEVTRSPLEEDDDLLMASMRGTHPFFNEALIKDASSPPSRSLLWTLECFYQRHEQPYMVHACCAAEPERFRGIMAENGYTLEAVNTAMAMDASSLNPVPRPSGLRVRSVDSSEDLIRFCRTACRGNELPPSLEEELVHLMSGIDPGSAPRLTPFIAERGDEPVATSVLLESTDCGVYFVSTIPEERGRGIGAWITYETVKRGLSNGCRSALVEASPAGIPMYHRIGFSDLALVDEYVKL
jgi:GNAT superfamily N-acetyltransferase